MEALKAIGIDYAVASIEVIEVLLEDPPEPGIYEEIARANTARPEILQLVMEHHETPQEVRTLIAGMLQIPDIRRDFSRHEKKDTKGETLLQKIQQMTVSQRVQLALKGGREIRGILLKDTNKEVSLSVLENGKITISEIEMIVMSRSVTEEALRKVAKNRDWMKTYSVVHALVANPKTPAGISVTHISDIKTKDLVILEKNRNVAEVVRSAAKKMLQARKPR